jgi:zinc transport system substrate-binding protein
MGRLAVLLLLAVTACGDGRASDEVRLAAAFYPLAYVAERVGGEPVTVSNLTAPGVEPHDLELTPRQAEQLEETDLAVYVKGFQPAVDAAVPASRGFDVTTVTPLDGEDPHVWLDPTRLARIATALGERLAGIDAGNAAAYRERAAALAGELGALDREFRTGLAGCRRREIVTSHESFGYLARRYGLEQIGIAGLDPEAEPPPRRVAEVSRLARERGVTTIFFETLVSPDVAETVAQEAGVATAVLDPVEGLAEGSGDDYFSVMRRNLAALRAALGC